MIYDKFDPDMDHTDIIETFDEWMKNATTYHDELTSAQKITGEYYRGNQTDLNRLRSHEADVVVNRIFEATETLVPIVTANAHQFMVLPALENEKSMQKAEAISKVLRRKYDTLRLQEKLEEVTRSIILKRFGVLKYVWSEYLDDIDVEYIDPSLIWVPKVRVDPHRLPYVIEEQEYEEDEIEEFFPKVDIEKLSPYGDEHSKSPQTGTGRVGSRTYKVYEVWTDEAVAWISSKEVLDIVPNFNWDFSGEEREAPSLIPKKRPRKTTIYRNHLDRPEKPYVFFTTFNVSDGPFPPVSLAEIAIPIQDDINTQKRQIVQNLKIMGNGRVLADSEGITEEESQNITNEPGQVIRGSEVASKQRIRFEAATPLPASHFSNLQHSEAVFDNVMGVHSSTRGNAQSNTLGQDMISRQQDYTRIDLITRVLNRGVYRLANGLVQLMKLYYTSTHVVKILGDDGAIEFVHLNRNDIEDNIEIDVKSGMTLPMDEVQLRNEAVQLWQLQAIDPVTLFQRLKFPNPEKAAERLQLWKAGQLSMETQAKLQEMNAQAQNEIAVAKATNAMGEAGGESPKGTPTGGGAEEKGRSVETPFNVIQRARQGLGGTAPLTATPNQ